MSEEPTHAHALDPELQIRSGVRRDGMPWVAYTHPAMGNSIRLALPQHADFESIRLAAWDAEVARKGKPWNPAWNQPA